MVRVQTRRPRTNSEPPAARRFAYRSAAADRSPAPAPAPAVAGDPRHRPAVAARWPSAVEHFRRFRVLLAPEVIPVVPAAGVLAAREVRPAASPAPEAVP